MASRVVSTMMNPYPVLTSDHRRPHSTAPFNIARRRNVTPEYLPWAIRKNAAFVDGLILNLLAYFVANPHLGHDQALINGIAEERGDFAGVRLTDKDSSVDAFDHISKSARRILAHLQKPVNIGGIGQTLAVNYGIRPDGVWRRVQSNRPLLVHQIKNHADGTLYHREMNEMADNNRRFDDTVSNFTEGQSVLFKVTGIRDILKHDCTVLTNMDRLLSPPGL
jgi:hypothetical protein